MIMAALGSYLSGGRWRDTASTDTNLDGPTPRRQRRLAHAFVQFEQTMQPLRPEVLQSEALGVKMELETALSGLNDSEDTGNIGSDALAFTGLVTCGPAGLCTDQGGGQLSGTRKRRQMLKMVFLILSPIVMLLPVSLYFIVDNVKQKFESDRVRQAVLFSTDLGRLIHIIQKERDMSVLYLTAIGPETKSFLNFRYLETDEELALLSDWPVDFTRQKRSYFQTRRALQRHLTQHRNEISTASTIFSEVQFYSDIITVFLRWMYDAIVESKFGLVWKVLTAYQKVVIGKEELSIERTLGTAYFAQGRFYTDQVYNFYNAKYHAYSANIDSAMMYAPYLSDDLQKDFDMLFTLQNETSGMMRYITSFRRIIQSRSIQQASLLNATRFYDNMSMLIDEHLTIQQAVSASIIAILDKRSVEMATGVTVSSLVVFMVMIMCPILIRMVQKLTDNIQSFAVTLADKTKELNLEKKRTDSLLYQMLPKAVAEQLKRRRDVTAEFYKEATIFFSDIVGFTRMTEESSPMDIVTMLNDIYTLFDQRIGLYDVYKVETIGDSYMVASGLPNRNGARHVTEIADLSLDLLGACADVEMPLMPGKRLRIRVGMHTGQCVAGVVGMKLPRYCLFGDTINTASRMETNGLPNRIHCSASTYKLLSRAGSYVFQSRGPITIKGKGVMTTYFLLGRGLTQGHKSSIGVSDLSVQNRNKMSSETFDPKVSAQEGVSEQKQRRSVSSDVVRTKQREVAAASTDDATRDAPVTGGNPDDGQRAGGNPDDGQRAGGNPDDGQRAGGNPDDGQKTSTASSTKAVCFPPPSYQELEREHQTHRGGSPPIFKVVEGYHF